MRKLFLLIPALVLSLLANAAVINITPTSPYGENDNLRKAVYYAAAGDEIILADGTYFEPSSGGYLELNKNITIKAAEGAHPIIQMQAYAKISNGANVSIDGLKFDGSAQGSYDYYIRFYDNSSTSLELNRCEFYGVKNIIITGKENTHTNSLTINNCYFHNNAKQAIYFYASDTEGRETCDELTITNSTFANTTALTNWISLIDIRPYGSAVTDAIKVIIDHCTFYNNPCVDSGHANIRTRYLSDVSVSNCIFMHPTELAQRAAYCDGGGSVSNCITYNFTKDSERAGITYGCTITNCVAADPLFTNAATGDFSFAGDWTTMELSPARGAATDGSDLGDPRWYSAETLPTTDFTSPYQFIGIKALLAGNIRLNASNHIEYYNKSVCGTATWKIQATKAATLQVTLNMESGSSSGHKFQVDVLDADGENVGMLAEPSQSESDGDIELSGTIRIPAAGNYTVVLSNLTPWSSAKIEGITFSALGGAATDLPATLEPTKAVLSTLAYTEGGELYFTPDPDSKNLVNEWAMWKVNVASNSTFLFTMNVTSTNTQSYKITILDEESVEYDAFEKKPSSGAQTLTHYFYLEAGEYYVKVQNTTSWSNGHVVSLVVTEPDILVLDDNATDNSYLTTHEDEVTDIQIMRTLLPGMYNTICLPFPVNSISALQEALGCEVELLQMSSAAIEGSVLTLEFSADGSMYQGKPFLIKPAKKVINPVFKSASIKRLTAGSTSGTAANFIGTFIKTTIPEDPNNLFLGANNNLYFPEGGDMPIKGMRAYFAVTGSSGAPVRQARIVAQGNVATEVELINGQLPSEFGGNVLRKSIENGQLIIIRDGVQYNALGVRVK